MKKQPQVKSTPETLKKYKNKYLTASEFFEASINALYCQEDFDAWLEMRDDPNARECIYQGLKALNISCKPHGSYDYYKSIVSNHVNKTKKIASLAEMENTLLILLYQNWMITNELRETISKRSENPPMSLNDFYKEIFIYFVDDVERLGGTVKHPKELWFSDEKAILDRLTDLYKDEPGFKKEEAELFVKNMQTLEGLYPDGETKVCLSHTNSVTRNNLMWLSYDYTVSQKECFGHTHHESFPQVMRSFLGSDELKQAGFEPSNYQNCLDVYLAFSAYKYINSLPKRKRGT